MHNLQSSYCNSLNPCEQKKTPKIRYGFCEMGMYVCIPDFLGEDDLELASEVLRFDSTLEVLASQDAFLRVLDVVGLLVLYHPFDPTGLHLPLHKRQRRLQVPVQDLHPNPSPLFLTMMVPVAH